LPTWNYPCVSLYMELSMYGLCTANHPFAVHASLHKGPRSGQHTCLRHILTDLLPRHTTNCLHGDMYSSPPPFTSACHLIHWSAVRATCMSWTNFNIFVQPLQAWTQTGPRAVGAAYMELSMYELCMELSMCELYTVHHQFPVHATSLTGPRSGQHI